MDIRKLQRAVVDGLEDVKAQNIVVFNTEHLSPLFERVIIASGTSNRQTKSLAASVRDAVKGAGFPVLRTEGEANGEWIIVDCGAAVVHVMQPSIREYYHLEEIWGEKPVNMKLNTASGKLVKASEPEPAARSKRAPAAKGVARKAPARNSTAKTAPAEKATAKKAPAKKAPAKKPPPSRAAVQRAVAAKAPAGVRAPPRRPTPPLAKATVTRVVGVKRAAVKTPVARKTGVAARSTAKAAPAKRSAAPQPAAKKAVARKSPSRA